MSFVRAYVGVTDQSWYQFLAARPQVTEVNFWQPSERVSSVSWLRAGRFFFSALASSQHSRPEQQRYSLVPNERHL
jgi:hypothetical protein